MCDDDDVDWNHSIVYFHFSLATFAKCKSIVSNKICLGLISLRKKSSHCFLQIQYELNSIQNFEKISLLFCETYLFQNKKRILSMFWRVLFVKQVDCTQNRLYCHDSFINWILKILFIFLFHCDIYLSEDSITFQSE